MCGVRKIIKTKGGNNVTTKELLTRVKAMTSEYDYFDEETFFAAANTALSAVHSDFGTELCASVFLCSVRVAAHFDAIRHTPGNTETFFAEAKAYSFRVFGKGEVQIAGATTVKKQFDGQGVVIRGFLSEGATVSFLGDFAYTVTDLAFFAEAESDRVEDVPIFKEVRAISLGSLVKDIAFATSQPKKDDGTPTPEVFIENGYIFCPWEFAGKVNFTYKRLPTPISAQRGEVPVDVPAMAEHLLVLLSAAYMLADLCADSARVYLEEYKRAALVARRGAAFTCSERYFDSTGWA